MPPKDKKPKKSKKAEEVVEDDELNAVDKQFYELQINDLNKKMSRLRAHNAKIEEQNEELETKYRIMEEDRSDISAYLSRTLKQKVNVIQELEDKLTELSKVREDEGEDCKKKMNDWDHKFKTMCDQLTSEIKLLTGKLNSMEEFRMQRDELMAKFDSQDADLKEQQKRHKSTLYEMERKVILDKERLRKDVENKLLELSTEFSKTSEIRVAAHTQRLVRENIALNNEMDRMVFTHERIQKENDAMKKKHQEVIGQFQANSDEKKRLIKTCEQQTDIIEKLTEEYEEIKSQNAYLREIKRGHEVARKMSRDNRGELCDLKTKIKLLEQHICAVNSQKIEMKAETLYHKQEKMRIADILKAIRCTVKSALKGEEDPSDDLAFRASQRENLLSGLLNILNDLEDTGSRPSIETLPSIQDIYIQGDLGIIPKEISEICIVTLPKLQVDPVSELPVLESIAEKDSSINIEESDSDQGLKDVMTGSELFNTESESIIEIAAAEVVEQPLEIVEETPKLQEKKLLSIDLSHHPEEELVEEQEEAVEEQEEEI